MNSEIQTIVDTQSAGSRGRRRRCGIGHMALAWMMTLMVAFTAVAQNNVTDTAVSDAVEDELMVDQAVPAFNIDITTNSGIVTLMGTVDNVLAKDRAARIAEAVKGVRAVVNRIEVIPDESRTDPGLASAVDRALLEDAATESFEIDVSAKDGKVTLTGNVDSWQEKQLATRVAKGVSGVKSVTNNIDIEYARKRPDGEIKAEVKARLRADVYVDDSLVDVAVKEQKVTLTGTVGSAAEKNRAAILAWVAGVKDVTSKGLNVARWARDEDMRKEKYVTKTDKAIRDAVKDALTYDPRVLSFNVTTEVDGGVVTLRGKVNNLKAKRAAKNTANNVVGVTHVENRLKVRPQTPPSDNEIENRVESALLRNPYVESFEVGVDVDNGVATLAGEVDTFFERTEADDVASRVNGVIAVINKIDVDRDFDPYIYDPYVDPYDPYDYDWYDYDPVVTFESDAEIQDDIQDELFWSPFVDSDDVTVLVDNGVATLTGTVGSWSEREAASENAYEGGAIAVDNDLIVSVTQGSE